MSENEQTIVALLKQRLDTFDKKLDCLTIKIDNLLSKDDAKQNYATKIELEKIKSRINFYAWLMPILTSVLGFMAGRFIR